jgi:hypothetical protein
MRVGYRSVCCFLIAVFGAITWYYGGLDSLTASALMTIGIFKYVLPTGDEKMKKLGLHDAVDRSEDVTFK